MYQVIQKDVDPLIDILSEHARHYFTLDESAQKDSILYTCSMHSEIQSSQPGTCPKCGMTLIKKSSISGKEKKRHKMSSMGIGMGIGMGIMMIGMLFI